MKKISAILLAGGSGSRFGGERNKVYENLGGKPVLLWSLDVLLAHPAVSEVVIAVRKGEEEGAAEVLGAAENPAAKPVFSVFGGITRTASVHNALDRTKGEIVLVHDGARPFLRREDIDACIGAMEDVPGAAIAVPLRPCSCMGTSSSEGFSTARRPAPVISKTASSAVEPKRFLMLRRIR